MDIFAYKRTLEYYDTWSGHHDVYDDRTLCHLSVSQLKEGGGGMVCVAGEVSIRKGKDGYILRAVFTQGPLAGWRISQEEEEGEEEKRR